MEVSDSCFPVRNVSVHTCTLEHLLSVLQLLLVVIAIPALISQPRDLGLRNL